MLRRGLTSGLPELKIPRSTEIGVCVNRAEQCVNMNKLNEPFALFVRGSFFRLTGFKPIQVPSAYPTGSSRKGTARERAGEKTHYGKIGREKHEKDFETEKAS